MWSEIGLSRVDHGAGLLGPDFRIVVVSTRFEFVPKQSLWHFSYRRSAIRGASIVADCGIRPRTMQVGDDACPHCDGLTESELVQLKEKIELRRKSLRALVSVFRGAGEDDLRGVIVVNEPWASGSVFWHDARSGDHQNWPPICTRHSLRDAARRQNPVRLRDS